MTRHLAALALLTALAGGASAGRVPSSKADRSANPGSRGDITTPFLTNGRSTLGVAGGVSPIIIAAPGLGGDSDRVQPVFNLIYYGSQRGSSGAFIHAAPREPNRLRPGK